MPGATPETLAPCVVVVGPANSGKTTFLHHLDAVLQRHPARPLVHVVKGNPDATGRYLRHAPELREATKRRAKGVWTPRAVETIWSWIANARRSLDLVLLDFGGRHSETNPAILSWCTHFIVVARTFDDPAQERREGMESWNQACRAQGLEPVAHIRSLWEQGPAQVEPGAGAGVLEATFRSDRARPADTTNQAVVEAVAERLLALRVDRGEPPYFDLRLDRDWKVEDLEDLAGQLDAVKSAVAADGRLRLGGRAPIWAYLAAMHRALDSNPQTVIELFEPKMPGRFVRIPGAIGEQESQFPPDCLSARWLNSRHGPELDLRIRTEDGFLPESSALFLNGAPLPEGGQPAGEGVTANGIMPTWIHATYSRWLRSAGFAPIHVWDGRSQGPVRVHPPVTVA